MHPYHKVRTARREAAGAWVAPPRRPSRRGQGRGAARNTAGRWSRGAGRLLCSVLLLLTGATVALAQEAPDHRVRIGIVLPLPNTPSTRFLSDVVADAARMGASMGGDAVAEGASGLSYAPVLLMANAPDAASARRAALRLIATEDVVALVGGVGEGQAEALHQVAREHGILFLNVGSASDALRQASCGSATFHLEASTTMYVRAMLATILQSGDRRVFVVSVATPEGAATSARALAALEAQEAGLELAGHAEVAEGALVFSPVLRAVRDADPDVVLLLLDAPDQEIFLAQYESAGLAAAVAAFPAAGAQTRAFLASLRLSAPAASAYPRVTLWDPALTSGGAGELNDTFAARWAKPMDPAGWAAYQAVRLVLEAAAATSSLDPMVLAASLAAADASFDVAKGTAATFRPTDHQLRQPLYAVQVDADAPWSVQVSDQRNIARVVAEIPYREADAGPDGGGAGSDGCAP